MEFRDTLATCFQLARDRRRCHQQSPAAEISDRKVSITRFVPFPSAQVKSDETPSTEFSGHSTIFPDAPTYSFRKTPR